MISIEFIKVGKQALSWKANLVELSKPIVAREIKRHVPELIGDVDFLYNEWKQTGTIYYGQHRVVGRFTVTELH